VTQELDAERRVVCPEAVRRPAGARDAFVPGRAEIRIRHTRAVDVGPAIEAAHDDLVELAGREVISEQIAAVVGGEERARARLPVEAHAVAQSRGVQLLLAAIRSVAHDRGAPRVVLLAHVAARPDRHVHPAIRAEAHGAGPVVAAARQSGHHALERAVDAAGRGIEANAPDRVGLRDVEPVLVQVHAVGTRESFQQQGPAIGDPVCVEVAMQQHDLAGTGPAHQKIPRGRDAHEARAGQIGGEASQHVAVRDLEALAQHALAGWLHAPAQQHRQHGGVDHEALGQQPLTGSSPQGEEGDHEQRALHRPQPSMRRDAS
jgi:hypothetical protein